MTRLIVSVGTTTPLAEVAEILDTRRIRQVPVLDGGRLVGMISRADLVRKLAEVTAAGQGAGVPSGQLQKAIWDQIKAQPWLKAAYINVTVTDGVVELYGAVDSEDQRRALRVLVEGIPGVRRVNDQVGLFPRIAAA